jgi:hypothetical protein
LGHPSKEYVWRRHVPLTSRRGRKRVRYAGRKKFRDCGFHRAFWGFISRR